jgi:hypothetical protein
MKIVKNALRNKIGDDYLSHSLICYVEKGLMDTITNEVIVDRFHTKKNCRGRNEMQCLDILYNFYVIIVSNCLSGPNMCFLFAGNKIYLQDNSILSFATYER